ncbi:MAG: T9SS type A sorting domain-containing protein [Candidatus Azobacteroides sp.]|nr:T9SS type A sorting domain-containing protein [Candidatus Azobacteroides sp.]
MKKTNFLFGIFTAMLLLWGVGASAQETATDYASFDAAFQKLKDVGGQIDVTAEIPFTVNYPMESTAPITINITGATTNRLRISAAVTLTIGNNITIQGSTTAPIPAALIYTNTGNAKIVVNTGATLNGTTGRVIDLQSSTSTVTINGGTFKTTGNGSLVNMGSTGATATINGGSFEATANGSLINTTAGANTNITGGTFTVGTNGRCINIGNSTATNTITISNTTSDPVMKLNGTGAAGIYCIQATNVVVVNINGNLTIAAGDGTSIASGIGINMSSHTRVFIKSGAVFKNLTSTTIGTTFMGDGSDCLIFDYNIPFTIIATPVPDPTNGYTFTDPDNVVLTIENSDGNNYANYVGICYTTDGSDPAPGNIANNWAVSPASFTVSDATVVVKARVGRAGTIWDQSTIYPFIYHVTNAGGSITLTPTVSNFAGLQQAFTNSQADNVTSTTITLGADITDVPAGTIWSMIPDAAHPVSIDSNGKQLIISGNNTAITLSGALDMYSDVSYTGTNGMFRLRNQSTLNITGGKYKLTGTGIIFTANTGTEGVTSAGVGTNLNLSGNASFTVTGGTTTTAGSRKIIAWAASDGGTINIDNCSFTVDNTNTSVFQLVGPTKGINITNSSLDITGTTAAIAFSQAPSNAAGSALLINGLTLSMDNGNVFAWGGSTAINTVIQDLTLTGGATLAKPTTTNTSTCALYDLRSANITFTANKTTSGAPVVVTSLGVGIGDDLNFFYSGQNNLRALPASDTPYTGSDITVLQGETLYVYTQTPDGNTTGVAAAPFTYDDLFIAATATGITTPSIDAAKAYIEGGILYLPESGSAVQIYNVSGQLVLNAVATGATVDVSSLAKGIYIVKAGVATFKVVK